jgi:NAD(P)-dependent dehydrogenase (short-subunit alcohol dehydrogenase family)
MRLAGRGAVVTGASQGLGRALAEAFVREGASVLLAARTPEPLEDARAAIAAMAGAGQVVEAVAADVGDPSGCAAVAERATRTLPELTALVNNAGVYGPIGRIEDVDWAEWADAVRINLFGMALMSRAVIPHFRRRGYGKIVSLSGGGATGPLPRFSAYAASKAAVVRLTETLAEELRADHIDVNAIAPGALNTRLLDQVVEAGPDVVGGDFHERAVKQKSEGGVPLERGTALAVFLASAASDGITGRLVSAVWDDWERLPERRQELADSDVFTLRRIVPKDRGLKW